MDGIRVVTILAGEIRVFRVESVNCIVLCFSVSFEGSGIISDSLVQGGLFALEGGLFLSLVLEIGLSLFKSGGELGNVDLTSSLGASPFLF